MKLRKEKVLFDVLLGTGLYLLESVRDRLAESAGNFSERARDTAHELYETASERAGRAADVIRGEDHRGWLNTSAAVLIGVGVGVAVGMLVAPAPGEETRNTIAEKVRDRFAREKEQATGTYGG